MEKLSQKIVERIKEEKIVPKPRWYFSFGNYAFWAFFGISVLTGAISFCLLVTIFRDNDWDLYKYLHTSPFSHFLISIPYFWILSFLLFLPLAYFNYRHTRTGYCCETFLIVALSLGTSILLGLFFHWTGMGKVIDNELHEKIPLYTKIHCCTHREDVWSHPELGLLGGQVLRIKNDKNFSLAAFGGDVWEVEEDEDIIFHEGVMVRETGWLKIIGETQTDHFFHAEEIRPWRK